MILKFDKAIVHQAEVVSIETIDKTEKLITIFYKIINDDSGTYLDKLKCEVKISSVYNSYVNTKSDIPSIEYTATINKVSVYKVLSKNSNIYTYEGAELHPFWNFIPERLMQDIYKHGLKYYQEEFFTKTADSEDIYVDRDFRTININLDGISKALKNYE